MTATRPRETAVDRIDTITIAGLVALAAALRIPALAPEALWLDDVWVAYAHRSAWSDITEIGLSAPGFSALLKAWFAVVGFGEFRAQVLPFVAAIAGPGVAYAVARARTGRLAALVAGGWIVFAPAHVEYGQRVKQYSLEVVFALVIIHLAWRLLEQPERTDRWRWLALVSSLGVLLSFPLASIAAAAGGVAAVATVVRDRRIAAPLWWLAVPAVTTLTWFGIVIRHRQYEGLRTFWQAQFIQTDVGVRVAVESTAVRTKDLFEFLSPVAPLLAMTIVIASFAVLLWRRPFHALVAGLPLAIAVVLAATERAPLGGGRTDLYLLAGLVLGTALSADDLLRSSPRPMVKRVAASLAAVAIVAAILGYERPPYPIQDLPALLEVLEDERRADDVVFVYHNAKWSFATYSDVPVTIRPVSNPYDVVFDDPLVIRQPFPGSPEALAEQVHRIDDAAPGVWLIGTQLQATWPQTIEAFEAAGWSVGDRFSARGAELVRFER